MTVTFPVSTPFIKGYKYRIYPNKEQREYLSKVFGSCRFVYNKILAECIEEYKLYKESLTTPIPLPRPKVGKFDLGNLIKNLRNNPETPWLKEIAFDPLRIVAHNLATAFSKFFKEKKGFPKFKDKYSKQSVTYSVGFFKAIDNKLRICLLKSLLKVSWNRVLPSTPSSVTITKTPSGKYYASFRCKVEKEWLPQSANTIGIDVGLTTYATLSIGEKIDNPKTFIKYQKKLKRAQQSLARKLKGSANRKKARLRVARIYEKIANTRETFQHQLSARIVKEYGIISMETLRIANMVKNSRLSKHIADAAWGSFTNKVKYKILQAHNRILALADPRYPSTQLCNSCGTRSPVKIKLGIKSWVCSCCGTIHDRDTNAAKNLELAALKYLPDIVPGTQVILFSLSQ